MTVANNRRREPGKAGNETALLVLALVLIAGVGVLWVSLSVGSRLAGVNRHLPKNPLDQITGLAYGTLVWPIASTVVAVGCLVVVGAAGGFVVWVRGTGSRGRTAVDRAGRYMVTPRNLTHLQQKQATATSARLGVTGSAGSRSGACRAAGRPSTPPMRTC